MFRSFQFRYKLIIFARVKAFGINNENGAFRGCCSFCNSFGSVRIQVRRGKQLFILYSAALCNDRDDLQALRCRTDDGPSVDELKKIARICMRKVGQNETSDESDASGDGSSSEESGEQASYGDGKGKSNGNANDRNIEFGNNRFNYDGTSYNGDNNMDYYGSLMPDGKNDARSGGANKNANVNGYQSWNNHRPSDWNGNQATSSNNRNSTHNQTRQDQACAVHCFFHELRLVSSARIVYCSEI